MKRKVIVVDVTAEDIKNGKPGTASSCPIALAAHRTALGFTMIDSRSFSADHGQGLLPEAARRFVRLFDSYEGVVQPQKFRFTITDKGWRD